jgi:hypothetical protein
MQNVHAFPILNKMLKKDTCICLYLSFSLAILFDSVRPSNLLTCYCSGQYLTESFDNDRTEFIIGHGVKNVTSFIEW